MELFEILTALTVVAAIFGYINVRFLKWPSTIGLLALALASTLAILIIGQFSPGIPEKAEAAITAIDFEHLLLDVMLSFLLFAGALHMKLDQLEKFRGPIIGFATVGVLISTFVVGALVFGSEPRGARCRIHLLPAFRRTHKYDRPYRRTRHFTAGGSSQKTGVDDRGRIAF